MNNNARIPSRLELHKKSRVLEIAYNKNEHYKLTCEYLRVYSPSAEQSSHGLKQSKLAIGKSQVAINAVKPVGHYAIQLVFSDGHDSGLYTWAYLYELCQHQAQYWQDYLDRLSAAGASRDSDTQVLMLKTQV